ncbi:MAG: hypothetical protein WB696_04215 [Chthoniobacterales bacterium]
MHAFHNRTDEVSRFVSSSVYYHEVYFNEYARIVNVDDPLPPEKAPTVAEAEQYLQSLKGATRFDMYLPLAKGTSGVDLLRELRERNRKFPTESGR